MTTAAVDQLHDTREAGRLLGSDVVYMPATADRPAEPAPWVLTEDDVIRLARMESTDPYSALRRYRLKGWLKATQLGNRVRFLLPDVLAFFERAKEGNPR